MPDKVSRDTFFYCVKLSENTSKIEIMRTGTWKHPAYGKFSISENDIDDFILHFNEKVRGVDIAIDLEHGETPHKGASAGWIKNLVRQGNSLLAEIEWTDLGKEKLKAKEYKYFSPEFKFSYEDHETGEKYNNVLMGGGLTNRPFIKNMQPVLLSEDVQLEEHQDNTGFIYISNNERNEEKLNKKLLGILKLDENATEEQVSEAIENVIAENETLTQKVESQETAIADKDKEIKDKKTENVELSEKVKTLTSSKSTLEQDNIKLSERVLKIEADLLNKEWDSISSKMLSEGKLTPAMAEKFKANFLKDKDSTISLMETLQPVVAFGEVGNSKGKSEIDSNLKLFEQKVKEIMARDKISYADALPLAEMENQDLFKLADAERGVK